MRGRVESDSRDLSPSALPLLSKAAEEFSFLLDRGYPRDAAATVVGNRYQFTRRQRLVLARAVSGRHARDRRVGKELPLGMMAGRTVYVDGFNALITLEVALSGGPVIQAEDGTVRDLAGLKGTYHPLDMTPHAIDLVLGALADNGAAAAWFLLDEPVSNSGRLRALIEERAGRFSPELEVHACTVRDPDAELKGRADVITSDSAVLDGCVSWYNLDAALVRRLGSCWVVELGFDGVSGEGTDGADRGGQGGDGRAHGRLALSCRGSG